MALPWLIITHSCQRHSWAPNAGGHKDFALAPSSWGDFRWACHKRAYLCIFPSHRATQRHAWWICRFWPVDFFLNVRWMKKRINDRELGLGTGSSLLLLLLCSSLLYHVQFLFLPAYSSYTLGPASTSLPPIQLPPCLLPFQPTRCCSFSISGRFSPAPFSLPLAGTEL